jgi:hypothetical protein
VVTVFRNKMNDDCTRVLDLHNSQFASVIRTGFQPPLASQSQGIRVYFEPAELHPQEQSPPLQAGSVGMTLEVHM